MLLKGLVGTCQEHKVEMVATSKTVFVTPFT